MLTVRFFAGSRAAAGVPEDSLPAGYTLTTLLAELERRHGTRLGVVLVVATYLVNGLAWHDRDTPLPERATVDVLPPFAGG